MPDVKITIGEREFTVACQEGEEAYLRSAAEMLNEEASALVAQIGRLPEARMLLMAGLMLADRTAAFEERAREAEGKLAALEAAPQAGGADGLPEGVADRLSTLAERAEAIAARAETGASG